MNTDYFCRENKSIEKVIVDCFSFVGDAVEYNRKQIIDDTSVLLPFNCRKSPRQRSKD